MAEKFSRAAGKTRKLVPARRDQRKASAALPSPALSDDDRLAVLKWHIERYDRLRISTASRAAVVLSAGAILSAGNALLLGQILGDAVDWLISWQLLVLTVAALASAGLVVSSLIRATNVLLTTRGSRATFAALSDPPPSLIFNGADTIAHLTTFADFRKALETQGPQAIADAAEVELWVCIHQHRHRYAQLRAAVRLLRYAALAFFVVLVLIMTANLLYAF